MRRVAVAFAPAALYAVAIFAVSSQSNPFPFMPRGFFTHDKLLHLLEYAVLGALLAPALRLAGMSPRGALLAAAVLGSLYGATDEFHQAFVPGRTADVLDWVADTLGAGLGALLGSAAFVALRRPGRAG
ncbi:MAG TPA: VanZ family protein [Anaeromyxobacteraceae bacterium]|nr:VanZ family protein [Anaeromyxobacteraceae bacterium]